MFDYVRDVEHRYIIEWNVAVVGKKKRLPDLLFTFDLFRYPASLCTARTISLAEYIRTASFCEAR